MTPRPEEVARRESVAPANGTLAVSSATSIDIYKDGVYLGSAPVSLELAAGRQTLEYRHGNLRKFVTHAINSNETTKAMVSFDMSVQINSKPWAEVFLEGTERKDLGQTPLSGVRVPIGGILSFQNPSFKPRSTESRELKQASKSSFHEVRHVQNVQKHSSAVDRCFGERVRLAGSCR